MQEGGFYQNNFRTSDSHIMHISHHLHHCLLTTHHLHHIIHISHHLHHHISPPRPFLPTSFPRTLPSAPPSLISLLQSPPPEPPSPSLPPFPIGPADISFASLTPMHVP